LRQRPERSIRSFVLRQGRTTPAQARALAEFAPKFVIPFARERLDLVATFGRHAPKILEIGFGMGETTAAIAQAHPVNDYLGVEVHSPGVGALLRRIAALGRANVRIIQHDAVEVVEHMIADRALDGVQILFPDPWPKKRHHKRRLVQRPFVEMLTRRMKPGAILHIATDWEDYAQHILSVLAAEPMLENTAAGYAPRPLSRPLTKFEGRGLELGHRVWDIAFRRR
jgi:tRNA (guanine-N7-)-methyltransferase